MLCLVDGVGNFACLALFAVLGVLLLVVWRAKRGAQAPPSLLRDPRWLALLGVFLLLALTLPEAMPVHDHNSYVKRTDCAVSPYCEESAPWGHSTLTAYELVFSVVPYRVGNLGYVSLAFSLLSLVLMGGFLRRLFREFEREEEGRWVAWLAAAVCILQPGFLRLSVAATFYPYTMCALWGAAWMALDALRRPRFSTACASMLLLALAAMGVWVQLVWLPLAAIAPLCWRKAPLKLPSRKGGAIYLGTGLLLLAIVAPHMWGVLQAMGEPGGMDSATWSEHPPLFAETLVTSAPFVLLFWFGAGATLFRIARGQVFLLPLVYAFVATEPFLAAIVDLVTGYPTRFIHGFISIYFSAIWVAIAMTTVLLRLPARWRATVTGGVLIAGVVLTPLAETGVDFLFEGRMLNRELTAFSTLIEELPEHDYLVIPPTLESQEACERAWHDPPEVHLPLEEYRQRTEARFGKPVQIVRLEDFLHRRDDLDPERGLVYVGSILKSFVPCEDQFGLVPDNLERPFLTALRESYLLTPARILDISTADNAEVACRLTAGRHNTAELGFYRLTPR